MNTVPASLRSPKAPRRRVVLRWLNVDMDAAFEAIASDSWPVFTAPEHSASAAEPSADFDSPSLRPAGLHAPPSYELKYVLTELEAASLEAGFSRWMSLDPHADAALDHSYRISTIYTDTPRRDVFHRAPQHRRTKFRIRRYGDSATVFLERKTKRGRQVSKNRVAVDLHQLSQLSPLPGRDWSVVDWPGAAYGARLRRRGLEPVCAVSYLRRAYFSVGDEGRMRVTFDRELAGQPVAGWSFDGVAPPEQLARGMVVCEFKFRGAMPVAFKRAIGALGLLPGGFSKYRGCMTTLGLEQREQLCHA